MPPFGEFRGSWGDSEVVNGVIGNASFSKYMGCILGRSGSHLLGTINICNSPRRVTRRFRLRALLGGGIGGGINRVSLDFSTRSKSHVHSSSKLVLGVTRSCVGLVKVIDARFVVTQRASHGRPRYRVICGHISGSKHAVDSGGSHCQGRGIYGVLATHCHLRFTRKGRRIGFVQLHRRSGMGCFVCRTLGQRIPGTQD